MIRDPFSIYIQNTEDPQANFNLALFYWNQGHTASALSFFLRCADRTDDDKLAYECLIMLGHCFDRQGRRETHTLSMYRLAQNLMPKRPEAYYIIARWYERRSRFGECYNIAVQGLNFSDYKYWPRNELIDYPGAYGLIFEKAVAAWWVNKEQESRLLFRQIAVDYHNQMDEAHKNAVYRNITMLSIGPKEFQYYDPSMYNSFRWKFDGLEKIQQNYSQCFQDMFVLSILKGKRNGTYLEIGSADPYFGNNTALLEFDFDWKGVGLELKESFISNYRSHRKNPVLNEDATLVDYEKILGELSSNGTIDYLQLDVEPPWVTYEVMTKLPFDKFKFAVITYEHDYYIDPTKSYRQKSRDFLESKGYVRVVSNISSDGHSAFEDWWVHPELIDPDILNQMQRKPDKTWLLSWADYEAIEAKQYMFESN